MVQYIGSWLIAIATVWPVAIRMTELGDKPIDLVLSDFLYLLLVLTPPRRLLAIPEGTDLKKLAAIRVSAVLCILYCLGLSLAGYAVSTELTRVVSAAKFVKPITFLLLGKYLAMVFPPLLLIRRMATAFAFVAIATMGTALTNPAFPRCNWAKHIFAWETYGFPNMAMTFYGVMLPLLVAAGDIERRRTLRLVYRAAAAFTFLMVVFSLSRSSTISMAVAVMFYLYVTGRGYIPVAIAVFGMVLAAAGAGLLRLETNNETIGFLQHVIENRISQTVEGEDPFSGRGGIWTLALDLSSEKPIFGYAFEPFSRYSRIYDTPHHQYLEIFYKTGVIGTAIYLWMLLSGIVGLGHLLRCAPSHLPQTRLLCALLAALLGTLVGNMSQPNLCYSVTANMLFLSLGLVLTRHGAAELVDAPRTTP